MLDELGGQEVVMHRAIGRQTAAFDPVGRVTQADFFHSSPPKDRSRTENSVRRRRLQGAIGPDVPCSETEKLIDFKSLIDLKILKTV
jgi:hypothetical protein